MNMFIQLPCFACQPRSTKQTGGRCESLFCSGTV